MDSTAKKTEDVASSHVGVRPLSRVVAGVPASDGAGVKLTRIIGSPELEMLDPFLLLDRFHSDNPGDYLAGFPSHPHRGFETVTYMLEGRLRHEDSTGRAGVIESGGVQWMRAARGIVHSEMPEQENGLMSGFQLWVNLPAALKMSEPGYQEFPANVIPVERREEGSEARVIAGTTSWGTRGPVVGVPTDPLYLDVSLGSSGLFGEPIPASHNAFIYVVQGAINVWGPQNVAPPVAAGNLVVLGGGDRVAVSGSEAQDRFLLVAGRRLSEPVARSGPFVMNTRAELLQAFRDFEQGRF